MGAIADKAALLKPGSLIVTITQRLTHPSLELVAQSKKAMSWGSGTFYVHRRKECVPPQRRDASRLMCADTPALRLLGSVQIHPNCDTAAVDLYFSGAVSSSCVRAADDVFATGA